MKEVMRSPDELGRFVAAVLLETRTHTNYEYFFGLFIFFYPPLLSTPAHARMRPLLQPAIS